MNVRLGFFLLVMVAPSAADARASEGAEYQACDSYIDSFEYGSRVKVFDHFLLLPKDYYFSPTAGSDARRVFVRDDSRLGAGSITFMSFSECAECRVHHDSLAARYLKQRYNINSFKFYGKSFLEMLAINPSQDSINKLYFLYDENSAIRISDSDPEVLCFILNQLKSPLSGG